MPGVSAQDRRSAYLALAATLGKLHSVKPADVGLADYSRNHGYCARQVGCRVSNFGQTGSCVEALAG